MEEKEEEGEEEEEEEEEVPHIQYGGAVETRSQRQRAFVPLTSFEGANERSSNNSATNNVNDEATPFASPPFAQTPVSTTLRPPQNQSAPPFDWNAPSTSSQVPTQSSFDWNAPSTSAQVPSSPTTPPISSHLPLDLIQSSRVDPTPPSSRTSGHVEQTASDDDENDDSAYFFEHSLREPKIFKNKRAKSFKAQPTHSSSDYTREMLKFRRSLVPFVEETRKTYPHGLKCHVSAKAKFDVIKEDEVVDSPEPLFAAKSSTVHPGDVVEDAIEPILEQLENAVVDYRDRGSNFVFNSILNFTVTVCQLSAFPIGTWIPTPPKVKSIKATINVKPSTARDNNFCFLDSINAILYPAERNKNEARKYRQYRSELNTTGISFPISASDIPKFERLNPNLSINVYGCDLKVNGDFGKPYFFPYKISKNRGENKTIINLLLIEKNGEFHFIAIHNLARLTRKCNSSHTGWVSGGRMSEVCPYCLQHMGAERMAEHSRLCMEHTPIATELPERGSVMRFKEHGRSTPLPYYLVGDFETREILRQGPENRPEIPLASDVARPFHWIKFEYELRHCETCRVCNAAKPCPKLYTATSINCRLEAFSWGYKIVSSDPNEQFPLKMCMEEGATEKLLISLKEDMHDLHERMDVNVPIVWTYAEQQEHKFARRCKICKRRFTRNNWKTKDHDHR